MHLQLLSAQIILDLIYTNVIDKSHTSGILITPISNHQMYFCTMNKNFNKSKTTQKYVEVKVCNKKHGQIRKRSCKC